MKFTGVCLITKNVRALSEFYVEALGMTAQGDDTHMELCTASAGIAIFSEEGMEGMAPGSMQGSGCGSITLGFEVADADAEYERIREMGAPIVKPPQTHPWGARAFWFRDPDGNVLDFYQPLR
jgi:predicted enzyme related to lactoylglutathione lyase